MENFNVDPYLQASVKFIKELETKCVAECCGIDAFNLSREKINEAVTVYNKNEIVESLNNVIPKLKETTVQNISSDSLNVVMETKGFLEIVEKIKNTLIYAK